MNEFLLGKMNNAFDNSLFSERMMYDDYEEGFEDACNLLIPILKKCYPYIYSQAAAEHMLDGFSPKKHGIDKLVKRIEEIIE